MDKVIIDTSAWIESFRPDGEKALGALVRDFILRVKILIPGIIIAELLRGTKNKKEYQHLDDLLKGLEYLPVSDDYWRRLSQFSFELFRKGVTVPLTDTYIALLGIENNTPILHRDKHFDLMAEKTPLKIISA